MFGLMLRDRIRNDLSRSSFSWPVHASYNDPALPVRSVELSVDRRRPNRDPMSQRKVIGVGCGEGSPHGTRPDPRRAGVRGRPGPSKDFGRVAVAHRGLHRRPQPPWLLASTFRDDKELSMTGTRLRWATRTVTAVAVLGAAILAPVFTPSASAAEPKLTITDARVTEGNTGSTDLVFTVTSSASGSGKVTVAFATGGGTATANIDYLPKQGTVTFAAGQRSATVHVAVVGDTAYEPDETVEVRLSNAVRATIADGLGIGTVANDYAAPAPPVLTVTKTGVGVGRVVSEPLGINCPEDCRESYSSGTTVTLKAYADSSSTFTGWTGACSGTGPCTVTMNTVTSVGANFDDPTPDTKFLQVWIDGWGSGTIVSSPPGINCASSSGGCGAAFPAGSTVTLTAIPDAGSYFNSFLDCSSQTSPCTVTMNDNRTVWCAFCPVDDLCMPPM